MGNKASVLFGAGPQNVLSDSEEHTSADNKNNNDNDNDNSALPAAAMSVEEQAEAKQYSELFGGKPKIKSSASGSRQEKKKQRFDGKDNSAGEGESGGGDGNDSAPGSPYRGKAAWAAGTDASGASGGSGKGEGSAPQAVSEEERKKQVMQAVSAKIDVLEKEKTGESDDVKGGSSNPVDQEEGGALVAVGGKGSATDAARARAAVSNALFAGGPQNQPSSQELLVGPSGASIKGGAGGAGVVADLPPATARTASPYPAPQRNFKLKN